MNRKARNHLLPVPAARREGFTSRPGSGRHRPVVFALTLVFALGALLAAHDAHALCQPGDVAVCMMGNGCRGTRECVGNGKWTPCECPGATVLCSVCGGTGTATCDWTCQRGPCTRAEVCNLCDDNGDGVIDEGNCFRPVASTACPAKTEYAWAFSSASLPIDPNNTANYINSLDYYRVLSANYSVKELDFRVDSFDTETGVDVLKYWESGSSTVQSLSGTPAPGWYGLALSSNAQTTPVVFNFATNATVSRPGFWIGRARVCSATPPRVIQTPTSLAVGRRHAGLLLGDGDVVFYTTPARSEPYLNVLLWGSAGNFDVYMRCNAIPTPGSFDYSSLSADSYELIIASNSVCTGGTWNIAVRSQSGAGHYFLMASPMKSVGAKPLLRAGTNWSADTATINNLANTLRLASRYLYGYTEGQILLPNIELYNNTGTDCTNCGGAACGLCFRNDQARSYCCNGSQFVIGTNGFSNPKEVAHEYSHGFLAIWDEYNPTTSVNQCGHSVMANYNVGNNNNFCYRRDSTHFDHGQDRAPGEPITPQPPVWEVGHTIVESVCGHIPQETPDNYAFTDHDFAGQINVVIR